MATNGASRPNSAQPLRPSECSGQPLTMSMIERALHRLRAQRPSCRCGLCEAAAKVSADRVYRAATTWQRGRWPRPWARMTH